MMHRCRVAAVIAASALLAGAVSACGGAATPVSASPAQSTPVSTFRLTSSAVTDGGTLDPRFTCKSQTGLPIETNPPLTWSGAPTGTAGFVILMSTIANDNGQRVTKYNWVLYDIPASVTAVGEQNTVILSGNSGTTVVGTPGLSSDGPQLTYSPPCSPKGSGLRVYTFTVYAVSRAPAFALNRVPGAGGDGANLAAALPGVTLAQASLSASYKF